MRVCDLDSIALIALNYHTIPLLYSPTVSINAKIVYYTSLAQMEADGINQNYDEYQQAQYYFMMYQLPMVCMVKEK